LKWYLWNDESEDGKLAKFVPALVAIAAMEEPLCLLALVADLGLAKPIFAPAEHVDGV
jgi:hypothetical protein